jgi:hypothetical protein
MQTRVYTVQDEFQDNNCIYRCCYISFGGSLISSCRARQGILDVGSYQRSSLKCWKTDSKKKNFEPEFRVRSRTCHLVQISQSHSQDCRVPDYPSSAETLVSEGLGLCSGHQPSRYRHVALDFGHEHKQTYIPTSTLRIAYIHLLHLLLVNLRVTGCLRVTKMQQTQLRRHSH